MATDGRSGLHLSFATSSGSTLLVLLSPKACLKMPLFTKLLTFLGLKKKEVNVLVVGLDNSGKSSVMNHFKPKETKVTEIVPTVGFSVEKFTFKNLNVTAFDMSGQGRYRNLWEHYYSGIEAIIFVIDSTDSLRFVVVRDELEMMLKHSDLQDKGIPILFLANKSDLASSQSSSQISTAIGLSNIITSNPWIIISSNAVQGDGLEEGIDWLVEQLSRKR